MLGTDLMGRRGLHIEEPDVPDPTFRAKVAAQECPMLECWWQTPLQVLGHAGSTKEEQ